MLEIIVVRHGQSVADIEKRFEGRADFSLTDLGVQQAKKLSIWIKNNYPPNYIISSPLKRASETAEIIGKKCIKEVEYDDDLMELNTGLLAGMLKAEANEKYPLPKGGHKPYEDILGGESLIEFRSRAEKFWSKLIFKFSKDTSDKRILIVSHGGMIDMLFRCFLNLPMNTNVGLCTGDTGVHIWKFNGDEKFIVVTNSLNHLSYD